MIRARGAWAMASTREERKLRRARFHSLRTLALGLCASSLITACAHRPPDPPASSSAQVIHYRGTSEVRSPDGKQLETMRLLLRRTLDPTHDLITEQIAQKTSRPEEAPREYIMSLKVSGSQFVITEPVTGLAGGGELYGDPWQWSS